jgi:23S rRNA pseudouridine955/2504/2580 synthase
MAHIGHPLLGDGKYGVNKDDKTRGYKYQALYSYRLIFDFGKDEGYLGYLSGKQVNLAPEDVWFVEEYSGGAEKIEKIIANGK